MGMFARCSLFSLRRTKNARVLSNARLAQNLQFTTNREFAKKQEDRIILSNEEQATAATEIAKLFRKEDFLECAQLFEQSLKKGMHPDFHTWEKESALCTNLITANEPVYTLN